MSAPPSLRLAREQRMKQTREFQRARTQGRRIVSGCLIFNWIETGNASRIGIVTTRKLGNAVVRSRARRLLREVFRLNQRKLTRPIDMVLVARSSIVEKEFAQVEADFRAAARKAGLLKTDEPGTKTNQD